MTKENSAKSRLALFIGGIYLVLALGSWFLPLIAGPEENMSAIFLILFSQPWASIWFWIADQFHVTSARPGMVFMLFGILLNTWLIYRFVTWASRNSST